MDSAEVVALVKELYKFETGFKVPKFFITLTVLTAKAQTGLGLLNKYKIRVRKFDFTDIMLPCTEIEFTSYYTNYYTVYKKEFIPKRIEKSRSCT